MLQERIFLGGEGGGDVHLFMSSDIKNALEAILGYYVILENKEL